MQLLLALADRAGRPLSSEALRQAVWGDQAITDGVAKNLVWQLRKSLCESADEPVLIETVPGAGYRLTEAPQKISEVASRRPPGNETGSHGAPEAEEIATKESATAEIPQKVVLLGGVAALAALAAFLLVGPRSDDESATGSADRPRTSSVPGSSIFEPATVPRLVVDLPGRESDIALDPEGRHLLFSRRGDSVAKDLYVLDFEDPAEMPVRLTRSDTEDGSGAWSPTGDRIAFVRTIPNTSRHEIHVMPSAGGESRAVASVRSIRSVHLEWRDASSLFISRVPVAAVGDPQGLEILDLNFGGTEYLTRHEDGGVTDRAPALSPDGEHLAFARWYGATSAQVMVLHLQTGELQTLTSGMPGVSRLAWLPGGERILFTATDASLWRLWWVPSDGSEPRSPFPATAGAMDVGEVAMSRSGVVAYEQSVFDLDMQRLDIETRDGHLVPAGAPAVLVPSDRAEMAAAPHPDGRRLAFLSDRTGPVKLWLADGDDTPRMLDVDGVTWQSHPSWSPDGTLLVLSVQVDAQSDVALVRADSGRVDRVIETPELREVMPTWRADGLAIRFSRPAEPAGTFDLWELELWRGDDPHLLVRNVLRSQDLPDGRMVATRNDGTLVLLEPSPPGSDEPRDAGAEDVKTLPIDLMGAAWGNWHATSDGVYWINVRTRDLRFYDFATETTTDVATLDQPAAMEALRLAPDRRAFYLAVMVRDDSRLLALRP